MTHKKRNYRNMIVLFAVLLIVGLIFLVSNPLVSNKSNGEANCISTDTDVDLEYGFVIRYGTHRADITEGVVEWRNLITPSKIISFVKVQSMDGTEVKTLAKESYFNHDQWMKIYSLVDLWTMDNLDHVQGCPECGDLGVEWIEMITPTDTKRISFEQGEEIDEIKDLIYKLRGVSQDNLFVFEEDKDLSNFCEIDYDPTQVDDRSYALTDAELPEGWVRQSHTNLRRYQVNPSVLEFDWQSGTSTFFRELGHSQEQTQEIWQGLAVFTEETIDDLWDFGVQAYFDDEVESYIELPNPNIGKKSIALEVNETDGDQSLKIMFITEDTYITLESQGEFKDWETLVDMTKRAFMRAENQKADRKT